ncbi:predicted protein [Nematostella vectensis]|uniref:N-acetyltransferase domain-containing protein n=1 Tax=Nematostella vectensis TaxID=45351 RepID=A7SRQ7_NEMVE|nr:predicted protein [Nematostella vectensis]|eukprot:XP_001625705.1 predicted protein [Nematostella vectensis]
MKYLPQGAAIYLIVAMFQVRSDRPDENNLLSHVIRLIDREKWRMSSNTCELILLIDPTAIYVGELNGKPIGFVVFMNYNDAYGFVSVFIIDAEYRGHGYGNQLFDAAISAISHPQNMALCSVDSMVLKYKKHGFEPLWLLHDYGIEIEIALQALNRGFASIPQYHAQMVDQLYDDSLINYDAEVFGHERKEFLRYFIRSCNGLARMASDTEGNIVGYLATTEAINEKHGYIVGPLYADSIDVAAVMLISLFEAILSKHGNERQVRAPNICVIIPQVNPEAKRLIDMMRGKLLDTYSFSATNGKEEQLIFYFLSDFDNS